MINNVTLVGRLTKDPDLRYTPAGVPVANFTLAVNRKFTPEGGEREADFIQIQVWRKPAENVANFLKKGSLAGVEGEIRTRNYEGNDGKRVYVTEVLADSVQFLEPKGSGGGSRNDQGLQDAANQIENGRNNQNNNQGNYQQQNNQQRSQGNYQNNNQQRSQNNNQGNYQNNNQQRYNNNNQQQQRWNDDPFAGNGQIDISDDDLPF